MLQQKKASIPSPSSTSPSSPQLRDIEKHLEESFSVLVLECNSFCREMKQLLSDKLKIALDQPWTMETVQSPTVREFKQVTVLLNQDLKTILSLVKILLYGETPMTGLDSNEYKILKSCVTLNQLAVMLDQSFVSAEIPLQQKPEMLNLMKSLSDNIYGYQSVNPQFNELIKDFATRSPSMTQTVLPNRSNSGSRVSERVGDRSVAGYAKDIDTLRGLLFEKQQEFQKNNEEFSVCIEQYNRFIYDLKDQISGLNQQISVLQKDRQELKQHNLILLNKNGVPFQKPNYSRVNMKNSNRRSTLTEYDEGNLMSGRRSELPPYRVGIRQSQQRNSNLEGSFLTMTRLLHSSRR